MHQASERRAAHRALAAVIDPSQPERLALHLAAAASGPDESVAAALELAGANAQTRLGYAAASRALELAGLLSPDQSERTRRLLSAGHTATMCNETERALAILDQLLAQPQEPAVRADIQLMRGMAQLMRQPIADTHAMLVEEAGRIAPHDRRRAAGLLVQAYYCSAMAGATSTAIEEAARSLNLSGAGDGPTATFALAALGITHAMTGETVQGSSELERLRPVLELLDPIETAGPTTWAGMGWLLLEDWGAARHLFNRVIRAARAAAAPAVLPLPLSCLSELELRVGKVTAAYGAATEAVELAGVTGEDVALPYALQALARSEAVLGHDGDCREHVDAALAAARRSGFAMIEIYAPAALGLLALGRGRPGEALECLEPVSRAARANHTTQAMVPWAGDLIEAYLRCGRVEEARRELDELESEVDRTGQRWARACVERVRGVLAPDDEYEERFAKALEIHRSDPSAFETARTRLLLGQRRRRGRRRRDAREVLQAAMVTFEAVGAHPWAEQARAELRAAGAADTLKPTAASLRDLTAQELQVAHIVANGTTNNEAAAALFLSPKTIEFHLGNVYRKLGIRSRAELTRRVTLTERTAGVSSAEATGNGEVASHPNRPPQP